MALLQTLRRIVQEVNAAISLQQALDIMVTEARNVFATDACSIYLSDKQNNQFTLMATDGLSQAAVGKLHISQGEGIVSVVASRGEPINLDNVTLHPNYVSAPCLGEDNFLAYLGVPIIHNRVLLGVFAMQQRKPRRYDESEEAFLVTLCAQLGVLIAHAEATGLINGLSDVPLGKEKESILQGIPGAPGVGLGQVVVIYPPADLDAVPEREADDIALEIDLFATALKITRDEICHLQQRLAATLPLEEYSLFDTYVKILDGDHFGAEVVREIRSGTWAQGALSKIIRQHVRQFEAMDDEYLRERATDIEDLGRRVLAHLQTAQRQTPDYPEQTILVGNEVTPAALAEVPEQRLAGIVSRQGSRNSHVAILARAIGVPTVMGVDNLPVSQLEGHELIVDGYYGHVYLAASQTMRNEFLQLAQEERELHDDLQQLASLPAETQDGHRLTLYVNTGLLADAGRSLSVGAEGVGLYRTEVPFMIRDRFPSEEEQRVIYRQLLSVFVPYPVTMRTLDVGGDKSLPYFPVHDPNPFLGWRGIRITLDHPELFLVQVRAMLQASEGLHNLQIMLPMVSVVSEVIEAKSLIEQAFAEVVEEGYQIKMPPIGIMVEVPSAVYQAAAILKLVDFMSVGTNDLIQYLLAVDRNNARIANLYNSMHPAVLMALKMVINEAKQAGKPVGICGEMASDPVATILLLALGFDSLSMNAISLPRVKWVIRKFTKAQAEHLLTEVQAMDNPKTIRKHLQAALENAGLGGLIRAGK